MPDTKRILIDKDLPRPKQRWGEAHEIGHGIIPWHKELMLGDSSTTLNPSCHLQIESEANYTAGRLLFFQDHFRECLGATTNLKTIRGLAKKFGNSVTSTLWRSVECLDLPTVGMVTPHPQRLKEDFDLTKPCRYFLRSHRFQAEFSNITEIGLFPLVKRYCSNASGGPLGEAEILLFDDSGFDHIFLFETFYNQYEALTLGIHQSSRPAIG